MRNEQKNGKVEKRIALYGRIGRASPDWDLMEVQKQYLEEELRKHSDWVLYDFYFDVGPAETKLKDKPALLRLLKDAEHGRFDRVLAIKTSRIARSMPRLLGIIRRLKRYGVEIEFTMEGLATDDEANPWIQRYESIQHALKEMMAAST